MKIEKNITKTLKKFFSSVIRDEVETKITLLVTSKSQPFNNIPTKIVKDNREIFSTLLLVVLIQEYRRHDFLPP